MFTGLIQSIGTLRSVDKKAQGSLFTIDAELSEQDRKLGASVAVSGVCLTVIDADDRSFRVEAAFETLNTTSLGSLRRGDPVNLEPALRMGDALGGHLVSGHVDGIAELIRITARGDAQECWFKLPTELAPYVAAKGSICIDGVSLTVNQVAKNTFSVGIIPHTLSATTLKGLGTGSRVNIEVDLLARYIARLMGADTSSGKVTMESLIQAGIPGTQG